MTSGEEAAEIQFLGTNIKSHEVVYTYLQPLRI